MSQKIIDYTLDSLTPANPDGSCPATVTGCTVVAGPGDTTLGAYPQALDFSAEGKLEATLPLASLDAKKFCVRLVFKVDDAVTARQALAESNALPFSFYLMPGTGTSDFHLVSSVTTTAYGPGRASTEYFLDLRLGTWYAADLVYDTDTLAVFVNGVIYSVHAFPDGGASCSLTNDHPAVPDGSARSAGGPSPAGTAVSRGSPAQRSSGQCAA